MAGFLIAIISGALMSLQGAFNTNVTKAQRDTHKMHLKGSLGREKGMGMRNIKKRMNE